MTTPSVESTDRERRLGAILATYFEACDAGQTPDRQAILEQHPELADDLAAYFRDHDRFQFALGELATVGDHDASDSSLPPGPPELEATAEYSATPAPADDLALTGDYGNGSNGGSNGNGNDGGPDLPRGERVHYFGDYELLRVLGRGGMGVVYKARQQSLNRMVAVKMIRAGLWAGDDEVRRFRNEAEAVANLDHPQIVTIHEVGEHQGRHYFSMKLVDGPSLADMLPRYMADPRAAAALLAETARAVHHAHQRGILHRDLKPSNILVDGAGRPHVTDFGLARRIEGNSELSVSGAVLGTPAYMSPEQAASRRGAITTAVDVYGLGAVLYATLTGRPPFAGESVVETLEQVRERPPERPRGFNPRVDRDLETICLKCLEKDARRRYDSAAALADDLERWLRGEPILARRSGTWERAWKWSRRRPAAAALVGVTGLAVLTVVGLAVALSYQKRLQAAYDREMTFLYENRVLFAERELNDNTPDRADALLEECPPDRRRWEWNYLKRQCHPELMTLAAHRGEIISLAVSPDGRWLASGARGEEPIRIWDAQTGRTERELPRHSVGHPYTTTCAFSPDGTRLASVSGSRTSSERLIVRVVATGETVWSLSLNSGTYASVAYSPDGQSLVVAGARGTPVWLKVFDAASGQEQRSFPTDGEISCFPQFSPDGRNLVAVVGSPDTMNLDPLKLNEARVWDRATGRLQLVLRGHTRPLMCVRYSPDGQTIATAGYDAIVRLYWASDGRERLALRGHHTCINQLVFSPDGRRIASCSDDASARIWDAATGREESTFRGHRSGVFALAFGADGERLFTGDYEGVVKVWDATSSPEARTFSGSSAMVNSLAFSPDGRRLVSGSLDRAIRLWDVPTGRLLATWTGHTGPVWDVAFSPDGTRVASAAGDWRRTDQLGEVKLWDAATGEVVHTRLAHQAIAWSVAFDPDGRRLVTGGGEIRTPGQEVIVWDVATGTKLRSTAGLEAGVGRAIFSPDGRRIAAAVGTRIQSWDAETGARPVRYEGHPLEIHNLAYTPDGRTLLSAGESRSVRIWDAASGRLLRDLQAVKFMACAVAMHPDATRFVTGGGEQTVKLWDFATSRQLISLRGHTALVRHVAFSPDGWRLATCDEVGQIKLWDGSPVMGGVR